MEVNTLAEVYTVKLPTDHIKEAYKIQANVKVDMV